MDATADGLVERRADAEVPPRAEYRLTPLGETLRAPVEAPHECSRAHMDDVLAARSRADDEPAAGSGGAAARARIATTSER